MIDDLINLRRENVDDRTYDTTHEDIDTEDEESKLLDNAKNSTFA